MYLAIIALPLLGSIVSGFFGRKVGVKGAQFITSISIGITTCIAILIFYEVGLNSVPVYVLTYRWIDSESLNVLWGFNFDSLTVSMLIPVLIVSLLVHIYSIGYMSHDPHNQRFFSYLSLFTFMMIILVTANNFLLMFVGWEGVGVCSYLLVSFWFTRIAANQSSMSAFLTNRVGDCFLTLSMFVMLLVFGNLDYTTVFSLAPFISENIITIIGVCLLIGAMAKSSQIGLHVWLPLAMEGPTPVSALIHAATMVTAGVYLLMRASPIIEYSSTVLILCLWIGGITTIFSSLIGLFQQDIKKVIAYSTMSQLGMMVIAVGLSSYNVALFHLVNHAFYKGLLFLGAGAVIHAVADNQDFRKYGGFLVFLPLTYTVMLIASLSLVAFPFMTGFYSKDFILESSYAQYKYPSIAIYFIATIGAVFTTLYSVKVLYLTFLSKANGAVINYNKIHESDVFMSLPLIILAIFSIFFGYITKDMFIGLASGFFTDNSLFIHPLHEIMLETEFGVPSFFKLLPLILTISFTIIFFVILELVPLAVIHLNYTRLGYSLFNFFNLRFLVDYLYNRFITGFVLKLGGQTSKILDKGSLELLGPYGLEIGLLNISKNLSKLDTGIVTSYALYILIALVLYVQIPYIYSEDISVLLLLLCGLLIATSKFIRDKYYLGEDNISQYSVDLHKHNIKEAYEYYHTTGSLKNSFTTDIAKNFKDKVIVKQSSLFVGYSFIFSNDKHFGGFYITTGTRGFHTGSRLNTNSNNNIMDNMSEGGSIRSLSPPAPTNKFYFEYEKECAAYYEMNDVSGKVLYSEYGSDLSTSNLAIVDIHNSIWNIHTETNQNINRINRKYLDILTEKYKSKQEDPEHEERLANMELDSFIIWVNEKNEGNNQHIDEVNDPIEKYNKVMDKLIQLRENITRNSEEAHNLAESPDSFQPQPTSETQDITLWQKICRWNKDAFEKTSNASKDNADHTQSKLPTHFKKRKFEDDNYNSNTEPFNKKLHSEVKENIADPELNSSKDVSMANIEDSSDDQSSSDCENSHYKSNDEHRYSDNGDADADADGNGDADGDGDGDGDGNGDADGDGDRYSAKNDHDNSTHNFGDGDGNNHHNGHDENNSGVDHPKTKGETENIPDTSSNEQKDVQKSQPNIETSADHETVNEQLQEYLDSMQSILNNLTDIF